MSQSNHLAKKTLTIAITTAISDGADVRFCNVVGLLMPAAWTAAGVGFQVSYDGGTTYVPLCAMDYTASPPYGLDEVEILAADVPTAESVMIVLDPNLFLCATHVKVTSQTAGVAVNQAAARTLYLMIRDMKM
jgi:hypothetical protein